MTAMQVLVVNGFALGESPGLVERIEQRLTAGGHAVTTTDLAAEGFDRFMSAEERAAYHSDHPLITPEVAAAADRVRAAAGIVVCYPVIHGTCPPRVKSWIERVFVLGVGFEFLPSGRITGALDHVHRACVIGVVPADAPARARWRLARGNRRNDNGPCLARSFYLSSNRACRARYVVVRGDDHAPAARIIDRW